MNKHVLPLPFNSEECSGEIVLKNKLLSSVLVVKKEYKLLSY